MDVKMRLTLVNEQAVEIGKLTLELLPRVGMILPMNGKNFEVLDHEWIGPVEELDGDFVGTALVQELSL